MRQRLVWRDVLWKQWIRKSRRVSKRRGGLSLALTTAAVLLTATVAVCRTMLILNSRSMRGTIPESLGMLTALTYEPSKRCTECRSNRFQRMVREGRDGGEGKGTWMDFTVRVVMQAFVGVGSGFVFVTLLIDTV